MRQDQEFVDCVRMRRAPAANGDFAVGVVRVLEAALESLRQEGRAIKIATS
jgi:hypothetical protein